jgi:hypothetical protein
VGSIIEADRWVPTYRQIGGHHHRGRQVGTIIETDRWATS